MSGLVKEPCSHIDIDTDRQTDTHTHTIDNEEKKKNKNVLQRWRGVLDFQLIHTRNRTKQNNLEGSGGWGLRKIKSNSVGKR